MQICINNTQLAHADTHLNYGVSKKKKKKNPKADDFIMDLFICHGVDYFKRISEEYLHVS